MQYLREDPAATELKTGNRRPCNRQKSAVVTYLEHIVNGTAIRQIARQKCRHPSTILRQIRQIESKRDDPLIDEALNTLSHQKLRRDLPNSNQPKRGNTAMGTQSIDSLQCDNPESLREARRILRRLCETGAFLAIGKRLPKAVVFRENNSGTQIRTAVVDRIHAQNFALQDWIHCITSGKIARYHITQTGRAALKRLLTEERNKREKAKGLAEVQSPFLEQHKEWGARDITRDDGIGVTRIRYNLAESPLTTLARKKGKDGKPFLSRELVSAGERLREDFELAQLGPNISQNWDRFLTAGGKTSYHQGVGEGPSNARNRVAGAMKALGPGLSDIALRCCCFLEGLEASERRMGWSARSGKIVLRIALQRLTIYYQKL